MISPNATRPRGSRSRRWYSTWTGGAVGRGGGRRGLGGGSGGTGGLPGQAAERLAAVLVVAKLTEAGTGRREQHSLTGARGCSGGVDGGIQRTRSLVSNLRHVERGRDRVRGLSDQIDARDRRGGDGVREGREVGALQRSAEDQVDAARERGEALNGGVGVRRLGVVHVLDAAGARDGLEPVGQRRELAQRAVDAVGPGAGRAGCRRG